MNLRRSVHLFALLQLGTVLLGQSRPDSLVKAPLDTLSILELENV